MCPGRVAPRAGPVRSIPNNSGLKTVWLFCEQWGSGPRWAERDVRLRRPGRGTSTSYYRLTGVEIYDLPDSRTKRERYQLHLLCKEGDIVVIIGLFTPGLTPC